MFKLETLSYSFSFYLQCVDIFNDVDFASLQLLSQLVVVSVWNL